MKELRRVQALDVVYQFLHLRELVDARIMLYSSIIARLSAPYSNGLSGSYDQSIPNGLAVAKAPAGMCTLTDRCNVDIEFLDTSYQYVPLPVWRRLPGVLQELAMQARMSITISSQSLPSSLAGTIEELQNYDQVNLSNSCIALAEAYGDLHEHTDSNADLEARVAYATAAAALSLSTTSDRYAKVLFHVGSALLARFRTSKSAQDLDAAMKTLRYAYDEEDNNADCAFQLSWALQKHYEIAGDLDELKESIALSRQALNLTDQSHPRRCRIAYIHAVSYTLLYRKTGHAEDAEEERRMREEVIRLCPEGHIFRPQALIGLGQVFMFQWLRFGGSDTLDRAINTLTEASMVCPSHRLTLQVVVLSGLCNLHRSRFIERKQLTDLDEAVERGQQAVVLDSTNSITLTNLGIALVTRFKETGALKDLEDSTRCFRLCLHLRPPGHPGRDLAINNLGTQLILRFENTFNTSDISEAIALLYESASYRPYGHPDWASVHANIVTALKARYVHTCDLADLEEALRVHASYYGKLTESDMSTGWRDYYASHEGATLRRLRYERLGDVEDLNIAIRMLEDSLPHLPKYHNYTFLVSDGLAITYQMRARHFRSSEDARKSAELYEDILRGILKGQSDRGHVLIGLSSLHMLELLPEHTVGSALELYCDGVTDEYCTAQKRLTEGLPVLKLFQHLFQSGKMSKEASFRLLHAFRLTVHLLLQIAYFGLNAQSRYHVLTQAPGLAADAAIHAIETENLESAIEVLEEGRAIFWVQHLRLRTSFNELPSNLAEELKEISNSLQSGSREDIVPPREDAGAVASHEEKLVERRRMGKKFQDLVDQARLLPGLGRFMLNDPFSTLRTAAQSSPVLVLLTNGEFCGALLLRGAQSSVEKLKFNSRINVERLVQLNRMLYATRHAAQTSIPLRMIKPTTPRSNSPRDVLSELWNHIMRHVVTSLGLAKASGRARPRLIICATGQFSHIPIHAAGTASDGCWDYFVPTYTPTLSVLLSARKAFSPIRLEDARALLAAVPRPFKWNALPATTRELDLLRSIIPSELVTSVAPLSPSLSTAYASSASCADVLDHLPQAIILHLACHGYHDLTNPLDSGFVMRDRILTLTQLMELNLPNAFFAFLSACETARGAESQPDQAVHLAATMLFTGFKSVIGTMWSMGDVDGPIVAKFVYEELFKADTEFLDADSIPYALDRALEELRRRKLHPSRWAPYVHFGV